MSFSRAEESLFAGNKFELGESIFDDHLYSPILGAYFQNECTKENLSTQNSRWERLLQGRADRIVSGGKESYKSGFKIDD